MRRREFVQAATGAALASWVTRPAAQSKFPSRPITFVVPFAPGGGGDTVARLLARNLSEQAKIPVAVENRAGASGNIGAAWVMKSAPDGYTLLNLSSTYSIQAAVGNPGFDAINDMQPIVMVSREPVVLVVHPAAPWRNAAELAEAAKKSPGRISHGSAGAGSIAHLAVEEMAYVMGIRLLHVPYKGSSAAFTDLMGQTVDLVMTTSTFAGPFIKAGKARALGVAGAQRMPSLPDVPTFVEQGFQYQIFDWKAVAGPKGIPPEVVAQLSRDFNRVLAEPAVIERIESEGASVIGGTPEHMRQVVLEDVERWKRLVQKANIKIE